MWPTLIKPLHLSPKHTSQNSTSHKSLNTFSPQQELPPIMVLPLWQEHDFYKNKHTCENKQLRYQLGDLEKFRIKKQKKKFFFF